MPKIFGREPAAWLAFVAVLVELAAAYGLPLTEERQALVNAAATSVMGFAVAWMVARDKVAAAAGGMVAALMQLAVSIGLDISQETIALMGTAITAGLALYLQRRVTAPIAPDGSRVPTVTVSGPPGA